MDNIPLVSVICLCYNHEKFVVDALNSIKKQTYTNIELIIVDDFSNDNSVNEIKKWLLDFPNTIFIANQKNTGNVKSFNSVFNLSNGEYIIDFAADDMLNPKAIELQINKFQTSLYTNLGIVYGNVELVFEDDKHFRYFFDVDKNKKRINPQPTGDIYLGLLNLQNDVCSVSSMVKREVYEKLNGYNESLYYEDYDFWIKASRIYNFDFIDEILTTKRELKNSLSAQRFKRFNKKTRLFNLSTYKIVINALKLNKNRLENKAILKRIHYELEIAIRTLDPFLFCKYVILEIKIRSILFFNFK